MSINGRQPKYASEEERKKARNLQAVESKRRRASLRAELKERTELCSAYLCLEAPEPGSKHCAYHQNLYVPYRRMPDKCVKCGKIPVPLSTMCGYCEEEAEELAKERRNAHKREVRRAS